jgi:hypothetical protein
MPNFIQPHLPLPSSLPSQLPITSCKNAVTFLVPESFWQAITQPNLLRRNFDHFYSRLFQNQAETRTRLMSANWNVSSVDDQNYYLQDLTTKRSLITNLEEAQRMFVTSIVFRVIQIISLGIMNKIDNQKWSRGAKFIASMGAIIIPYLFMQYFCNWPMYELISINLLRNMIRTGLEYCNRMDWANFVRETEVVSTTRNFNFGSMTIRGLFSSIVNIMSTKLIELYYFIEYGKIALPSNSPQTIICLDRRFGNTYLEQKDAIAARHYTDELGWLAGRYAVDLTLSALYAIGVIKDLRDPLGLLGRTSNNQAPVPNRRPVAQQAVMPPREIVRKNEVVAVADAPREYVSAVQQTAKVKKTPSGVRKALEARAAEAAPEAMPAPARAPQRPDVIDIPGGYPSPMVRLYGPAIINRDIYGAVICDRVRGYEPYVRALRTGHVAAEGASMKYLRNGTYEIRPAALGDRVLGREEGFYDTARRVLPLGAAIELDRAHNPEGNVRSVAFAERVKHERITEALARGR